MAQNVSPDARAVADALSTIRISEEPFPQAQSSVEIERGQRGGVGWTIKKYTGSPLPDLDEITDYDAELKQRFTAGGAA